MPQGVLRATGPLLVTPRSGLVTSVTAVVLTSGERFLSTGSITERQVGGNDRGLGRTALRCVGKLHIAVWLQGQLPRAQVLEGQGKCLRVTGPCWAFGRLLGRCLDRAGDACSGELPADMLEAAMSLLHLVNDEN